MDPNYPHPHSSGPRSMIWAAFPEAETFNKRFHSLSENPGGGGGWIFPFYQLEYNGIGVWGAIVRRFSRQYLLDSGMSPIVQEPSVGHIPHVWSSQCICIRAFGWESLLHPVGKPKILRNQHLWCHPPGCTPHSATTGGGPGR